MTAFLQIPVSRVCLSRGFANKEDENGELGRYNKNSLSWVVFYFERFISAQNNITYVLDFTDSKKVFWLNPMIYDLGMLCFMPSTF